MRACVNDRHSAHAWRVHSRGGGLAPPQPRPASAGAFSSPPQAPLHPPARAPPAPCPAAAPPPPPAAHALPPPPPLHGLLPAAAARATPQWPAGGRQCSRQLKGVGRGLKPTTAGVEVLPGCHLPGGRAPPPGLGLRCSRQRLSAGGGGAHNQARVGKNRHRQPASAPTPGAAAASTASTACAQLLRNRPPTCCSIFEASSSRCVREASRRAFWACREGQRGGAAGRQASRGGTEGNY